MDSRDPISPNGLKRALVVSPHPDDESIGCGGTLRRHVLAGEIVQAIFLTSGEKGGHGRPEPETACLREAEAREAARILGLSAVEFWREPDGALRTTPRLVRRLLNKLRALRPGVLYVTHGREDHPDHQAAARLVRKAVRALAAEAGASGAGRAPLPEVWMYEVWTPLRRFDWVIDISATIDVKLAAVRAHASQCEVMQFDEACAGLARYRGEMHCWPEGDYAEAFTQWCPVPSVPSAPSAQAAPDEAQQVSGGVS